MLLENRNYLLFGITFPFHFRTSLVQNYREIPHFRWLGLRVYGHGEVKNVLVLAAIGVDQEGFRRILGVADSHKEDRSGWLGFLKHLKERGPFRLMVVPDHVTAISTKTHAGGPVPFAVCGSDVEPTPGAGYSESAAAATQVVLHEGHRLLPLVFRAATFSASSLTEMSA